MTHHTPRSREEIRGVEEWNNPVTTNQTLILEVLLDIRDMMRHDRMTVGEVEAERQASAVKGIEEPEKDPLFDEVEEYLSHRLVGTTINADHLRIRFKITQGRASALIDQLEAAGVITKKDKGGRRHVV